MVLPLDPVSRRPKISRWDPRRVARLGLLAGRGLSATEIAADSHVFSSPSAVRRKAQRLGIALRPPAGPRLPTAVLWRIDAAAARRGLDRAGLVHRLLLNAGSDDALIDNILDDL